MQEPGSSGDLDPDRLADAPTSPTTSHARYTLNCEEPLIQQVEEELLLIVGVLLRGIANTPVGCVATIGRTHAGAGRRQHCGEIVLRVAAESVRTAAPGTPASSSGSPPSDGSNGPTDAADVKTPRRRLIPVEYEAPLTAPVTQLRLPVTVALERASGCHGELLAGP